MGNSQNRLTSFKEERNYQEFEGILFGSLLWITTFLFTITSCLLVIKFLCRRKSCYYRHAFPDKCDCSIITRSIIAYTVLVLLIAIATCPLAIPASIIVILAIFTCLWEKIKNADYKHLKSSVHSILAAILPDLITKKTYTRREQKYKTREVNPDEDSGKKEDKTTKEDTYLVIDQDYGQVAIPMDENSEQVYLFGDKEIDGKSRCCSCYTYFYFISVVILAFLWFLAMVVENAVYRKTTTCNDINVEDNSFNCFNVSDEFNPTLIDCTDARNQDISVFCYLYQPNLAAFAIAFSTFKLLLFGITVCFKTAIKLAENVCTRWLMVLVQVGLAILSLVALPSALPAIHFATTIDIYFFHGNAVIRWVMYGLLTLTAVLVIQVPWCGFKHKTTFKSMALEKQDDQNSIIYSALKKKFDEEAPNGKETTNSAQEKNDDKQSANGNEQPNSDGVITTTAEISTLDTGKESASPKNATRTQEREGNKEPNGNGESEAIATTAEKTAEISTLDTGRESTSPENATRTQDISDKK